MNEFSLTDMALQLLQINKDFLSRLKNPMNARIGDFELIDFEQTWGSTSLGFGSVGGSTITSARTYVLIPVSTDEDCLVYFDGAFAYSVPYGHKLMEDVKNQRMVGKWEINKYLEENK